MDNIFDPKNQWLNAPPLSLSSITNKRPVAVDDAVTVLIDSAPVSIAVLANDFDPEGQTISLTGAAASLGTAVAESDNTVTYTPPPGIAGNDTIVYTITDDQGLTQNGQVNIVITEPQLSIETTLHNTLVVHAETGSIDVTVTTPAEFAGTWAFDTADLVTGPINLVPPDVSGTFEVGQVLIANPGLWAHSLANGEPLSSLQWQRGGVDVAGETGGTYTVSAADIGPGVTLAETLTDTAGQNTALSAALGAGFTPAESSSLVGWWDASDPSTITSISDRVSSWSNKAGGDALVQSANDRRPGIGMRSLNGTDILDFDGTRFLEAPGFALPASGNVAFHMALAIDAVSNAYEAVLGIDASNDFQIDARSDTAFDGRLNMAGIGSSVDFSGGPFSGALILSVVFDLSGTGTAEVYIANTLCASAGYGSAIDSTVALHLMTNRSRNAWIDGAVAELIVTGETSNRASYHTYLANKWGLV